MKYLLSLLLLVNPISLFAQNGEVSTECVEAMRDLYRFYYHEVYPNPKSEACKHATSEKLDQKAIIEMQIIISELKSNCSKNLIAQINDSFPNDPSKG